VVELEQRVERAGIVLVALELVEQLSWRSSRLWLRRARLTKQVAHAFAEQQDCSRALRRHRLDGR